MAIIIVQHHFSKVRSACRPHCVSVQRKGELERENAVRPAPAAQTAGAFRQAAHTLEAQPVALALRRNRQTVRHRRRFGRAVEDAQQQHPAAETEKDVDAPRTVRSSRGGLHRVAQRVSEQHPELRVRDRQLRRQLRAAPEGNLCLRRERGIVAEQGVGDGVFAVDRQRGRLHEPVTVEQGGKRVVDGLTRKVLQLLGDHGLALYI